MYSKLKNFFIDFIIKMENFIIVQMELERMGVGRAARVVIRSVCSIIGAIIPFFMMSSYLSPSLPTSLSSSLPSSPTFDPLGSVQALFGSQISSTLTGPLSSLGPLTHLLPFAAAGGSGIIVWMIVQQVLGRVQSLAYSSSGPKTNPADIMKNMGMNMPWSTQSNANVPPQKLPDDITNVQFMILKSIQQGYKKSKEIEKMLSLDKKEIEKETVVLKTNGYLTNDNKLTSKGLEVLTHS